MQNVPELRKDPIIGRWVIISRDRARRPSDYLSSVEERKDGFSPFSPGNERMTPPEIYAIRPAETEPDTPGWSLRVIPNKYPALVSDTQLNARGEGIYDLMNGVGAHEVVIETPDVAQTFSELDINQIASALKVFGERMTALKRDVRLKYAMVFKNHGFAAGASLKHSHSQIIGTPIIPKRVQEEIDGASEYFQRKNRCIFCDILQQELRDDVRVAFEEEQFVALQPYAARFPFETWILPRKHISHYEQISATSCQHLAITLKTVLQKLNIALQNPPYNLVLHSAPLQVQEMIDYHWHLEIIPKVTQVAGFEWGSGFYINPTSPEDAAKFLREIRV